MESQQGAVYGTPEQTAICSRLIDRLVVNKDFTPHFFDCDELGLLELWWDFTCRVRWLPRAEKLPLGAVP